MKPDHKRMLILAAVGLVGVAVLYYLTKRASSAAAASQIADNTQGLAPLGVPSPSYISYNFPPLVPLTNVSSPSDSSTEGACCDTCNDNSVAYGDRAGFTLSPQAIASQYAGLQGSIHFYE